MVELVDEKEGILVLEWIEGSSVREWLGGGAEEGDEGATMAEETNSQAGVPAEEDDEEEEGVDLTPEEQREYAYMLRSSQLQLTILISSPRTQSNS